jgi:hypothetical protein
MLLRVLGRPPIGRGVDEDEHAYDLPQRQIVGARDANPIKVEMGEEDVEGSPE